MMLRIRNDLRLIVDRSPWFKGVRPRFGPQTWRWWQLVKFEWLTVTNAYPPPCTSRRLWAYTRWGSVNWDFSIDRIKWS